MLAKALEKRRKPVPFGREPAAPLDMAVQARMLEWLVASKPSPELFRARQQWGAGS